MDEKTVRDLTALLISRGYYKGDKKVTKALHELAEHWGA